MKTSVYWSPTGGAEGTWGFHSVCLPVQQISFLHFLLSCLQKCIWCFVQCFTMTSCRSRLKFVPVHWYFAEPWHGPWTSKINAKLSFLHYILFCLQIFIWCLVNCFKFCSGPLICRWIISLECRKLIQMLIFFITRNKMDLILVILQRTMPVLSLLCVVFFALSVTFLKLWNHLNLWEPIFIDSQGFTGFFWDVISGRWFLNIETLKELCILFWSEIRGIPTKSLKMESEI